jgi:glucosamine--fructose-6-phosphate aminotransferase (isomerizing)
MCGIVAYLGYGKGIDKLYEGLLILQNRGYDSAGISSILNGDFLVHKYASTEKETAFKLLKPYLEQHINATNIIGHSRFSCSGMACDKNSHPHTDFSNKFTLIHNGIIENYTCIKNELKLLNITFKSDTDTEVIVNLIGYYYSLNKNIELSIEKALNRLEGTWGLVIQCIDEPDKLYCARHGSPLLIGFGDNFAMVSSEQSGFGKNFKNYLSLDNHDIIILNKENNKIQLINKENKAYDMRTIQNENIESTPNGFKHWTLKEIHEQPESGFRAMSGGSRIFDDKTVKLGGLDSNKTDLLSIDNLILLGCGTSYHAGLFVLDIFKKISGFNTVQLIDGSDFEYMDIPKNGKTGLLLLSQSGETKDLHRCLEIGKENGLIMIGVVNVVDSMIAREVTCGVYLNAGREVGVASTKCFTSQIIVLSMIACWFAQHRNISEITRKKIIHNLQILPQQIINILENIGEEIKEISERLIGYENVFLLGRGNNRAIAMEGALKIKEIGYINAAGYSTASLKHGTYALLDEGFPVIMLLPEDSFYSRNNSVGDELKSRKAFVIVMTDKLFNDNIEFNLTIKIPKNEFFFGVLSNIYLQLIAYNIAVSQGNSVDTPKNLCKTVTVD